MTKDTYHLLMQRCAFCGLVSSILVDVESYNKWKSGELKVQQAFPDFTEDQRELLISGTCPACWDKYMQEEEYFDA